MVLDAHHRRDEGREKQGFEVDAIEHGVFSPPLCQELAPESHRFACHIRALAFLPGPVSAAGFCAGRRLRSSPGAGFRRKMF
jgi:hypothetical protein